MIRTVRWALILLAALWGVAFAASGPGAVRDTPSVRPMVLVYASPYSPNHPFSLADQDWMAWVEAHSGGRVRIEAIWAGALLSADQSLIELRHGIADIGLITPIYARGGVPLIRTQAGFYAGTRTFQQQVALYRCLQAAEPEFDRELSGLTVLAVQGGTLPGIITRTRAVAHLGDLAGLRLRVPVELLGVLRDLGADPIAMPMNEVYSALAKGVLDGVLAPAETLRSLHFAEVARHYWRLQVPRGAYPSRAMPTRRWLELPTEVRALLGSSGPIWEQALARRTQAADQGGETFGREHGVEFLSPSGEDQQRFEEIYRHEAQRSAASLLAYGIPGPEILRRAQAIAGHVDDSGQVRCDAGAPDALVAR